MASETAERFARRMSSQKPRLILHTPLTDGGGFEIAEDEIFDGETDEDHRQQACENRRNIEQILIFINIPAEAALPRRRAKNEFGSDQRPPCKRPPDLQAGEDRGKRRRDQDTPDVTQTTQAVVAPHHAQGVGYRLETRMRIQRDRPQHRMHEHENDRLVAEAEPDQRQRQQRDGRQRIEHGGERFQQIVAQSRHHCERGEHHGQEQADNITLDQKSDGIDGLRQNFPAGQPAPQRFKRRTQGRHEQIVAEIARRNFPTPRRSQR